MAPEQNNQAAAVDGDEEEEEERRHADSEQEEEHPLSILSVVNAEASASTPTEASPLSPARAAWPPSVRPSRALVDGRGRPSGADGALDVDAAKLRPSLSLLCSI